MAVARGDRYRTQCLNITGNEILATSRTAKLMKLRVYVGKHLNFGCIRKVVRGNAMVANRTREIRPSGMKRGAYGNVDYGGG